MKLPRLSAVEWCCFAFGLAVAHAFLAHEWMYPSHFDAYTYRVIAENIEAQGLFAKWYYSDLRTYGYPFILTLVRRLAAVLHVDFRAVLFAVQLAAYLAACFFLRASLARTSEVAARIVFCGLMLNFYVLIYPSASLTESLSLAVTLLAAACWLQAYRATSLWPLVAGSLVAGLAVMIRPANLFLLAAWLVGVVVILVRQRPAAPRTLLAAVCVAAAVALPTLPQLSNNIEHYGKYTPLLVIDLGKMAQLAGIQHIKYATGMPPVEPPGIFYVNPFVEGTTVDQDTPWRWYLTYPVRGAATLALHTFNMIDQDLVFTYSRDLRPWYRIPSGLINHAIVALGLVGLVLLGRRSLSRANPWAADAYAMLLVAMVANMGVHATSMVEMRFGLYLLLALFPLAIYASMRILEMRSARVLAIAGFGVAAYVVFALVLSSIVRYQSEMIRKARFAQHAGPIAVGADARTAAARGSLLLQRDRLDPDAQLAGIAADAELRG